MQLHRRNKCRDKRKICCPTQWCQCTRRLKSNLNVCDTHLLQIEDVVVEVILQLFICIVDAELLEAVRFKVLKSKNVQHADGQTLKNKIR